ncbi:acyl carrier protein [Streptomyces sp. NPDC059862]|uniref:acyl carrier protein n=1 Tax=Streptomyces sp. NPDC059862 TaxID=3346975 RepID=UPI0036657D86
MTRLNETKPLINAVRLATASVFVEGPPSVLPAAKRVEEGLVLFHTAMTAVATGTAGTGDDTVAGYLAICGRQRVGVRTALMDFASAARGVLDGDSSQELSTELPPAQDCTEELSWLLDGMEEALGLQRSQLDADVTLSEHGLDSLTALHLGHHLRQRHGLVMEESWFLGMGDQTVRQVAGHIAKLRASDS